MSRTGSEGVEPPVLFLPLWVCFTSTVIPPDGSLHFSALLISRIAHIHLRPAPQATLIKMHTPEIASAFQPPAGAVSFKDVCERKEEMRTNIRKEPATCRNFRQVHWLQLAFCKYNYLPFFIDFFTSNMRISPVLGRVLISTSFPRARISMMISISLFPMLLLYHTFSHLPLPTFSAKAAGFPAAMLISLAQFFLPALE